MGLAVRVGTSVALAIALSGCGQPEKTEPRPQPASGAEAGDFETASCTHVAGEVEYEAECGTLIVPENRYSGSSRLIALPVKRIRTSSSSPGEPIFHLTGGPGNSNMGYRRVEWFHDNHDIVLVGYRGVDGTVHLGCPEVTEAMASGLPLMNREGMAAQAEAYADCADRLTGEGIDLNGYTVLEVVDDVEAARQALGYDRINLGSGSYGTRLAQIYSWRYPDRVHRNLMVAVNPPGRFWWDGAILEDQILSYSALCEEDPYCSSRTDDLAASIQKALDNMPKRWLFLPVDRDAVLFATFMGLYSTGGAASTFDIWLAAAEGDYSGMALVSAAWAFMLPSGFAWGDSASKACSADYDFDPTVDYVAEVTPGPYLIGSPGSSMGWAAADRWPTNKIPDEYRAAQPSSVETLMLSGSLDVSTPAQNARNQLLPLLTDGEQVVLSGFAHTGDLYNLQPEATRHLLTTFYATGEVDASLFQPNTVNFEPKWGFPLIAKLILGGAVLAMFIALLLLRVAYRLGRRLWSRVMASCILALVMTGSGLSAAPLKVNAEQEGFAFVHASIIPMDEERVLPDQTVIVRDGRISKIGPSATTRVPEGVTQIDATDRYLIPGLCDMHVHVLGEAWSKLLPPGEGSEADDLDMDSLLFPYLANGVTTVQVLSATEDQPSLRDRIHQGEILGPRLVLAQMIDAPERAWPPPLSIWVASPAEARAAVLEAKEAGYDAMKVYTFLDQARYDSIVAAAQEVDMDVIGHIPAALSLEYVVEAGQRLIAHSEEVMKDAEGDYSRQNIERLADTLAESDTWIVPTLVTTRTILALFDDLEGLLARPETRYAQHPLQQGVWSFIIQNLYQPIPDEHRQAIREGFEQFQLPFTKALHDRGVKLLAGSDTGLPGLVEGFALHRELEELVGIGLTPYEALKTSTSHPYEYLGELDEAGTIQVGKRADLVLLEANPLSDIANSRKVAGVVLRGRWLSKEQIEIGLSSLGEPSRER